MPPQLQRGEVTASPEFCNSQHAPTWNDYGLPNFARWLVTFCSVHKAPLPYRVGARKEYDLTERCKSVVFRVRERLEIVNTAAGKETAGVAHSACGWNAGCAQVKLCYPLTMRAIPERLRDASCAGGCTNRLALPLHLVTEECAWRDNCRRSIVARCRMCSYWRTVSAFCRQTRRASWNCGTPNTARLGFPSAVQSATSACLPALSWPSPVTCTTPG